ncbi:MAG: hypothetical protein WC321_05895 [Candidatus Omnitrophota bacterium]|jgi:hypothetical protein
MEIIVATIGLLASAIAVSLTYFFTKKHQLKMEERRLKEEYYKSFIKALSDVAIDNKDEVAQKRLSEGFNSLIVIGGANVVEKLMEFHNFIRIENTNIPRNSEDWSVKHDDILNELVKAMRTDLFGNKEIKNKFPRIHLVGRKSDKR